jgi:hypothetical protein
MRKNTLFFCAKMEIKRSSLKKKLRPWLELNVISLELLTYQIGS